MQDSEQQKKSVVNMMLTSEWIAHYNTINSGAAVVCLQMLKRRPSTELYVFSLVVLISQGIPKKQQYRIDAATSAPRPSHV
jgi:hypothetical protein